jgi:hypothetical protein
MSKRKAIIIILAVILIGTALLYLLIGGKTPAGLPIFDGSPFGTPPEDVPIGTPPEETPVGTVDGEGRPLPIFMRLSDAPVAGGISFLKNGSTYVRFVDRATGHIYDMNPATLEKARIINVTAPRIYSAVFKSDASGYVARTLAENEEVIANTSVSIISPKATSTDYSIQTTPLRGNIDALEVLSNGNLIYAIKDNGAVVTSSFTGSSPRELFSMNFSQWKIHPITNSSALIVTKASESAEGYAYTLNIASGGLTKVLGPLVGLSALPNPAGSRIAFSHSAGGTTLSVANIANGTKFVITPATIVEKCVWSRREQSILLCAAPEGGLQPGTPDSWYDGTVSYSDRIWRFNTDTDTAELLLEPEKNFDTKIDAFELFLSPDEDWLFFINKRDLTLWGLRLVP